MASFPATLHFFSLIMSIHFHVPPILSASVIEDLTNLLPPPDFNATLTNNCFSNPSLRYCNFISTDLHEIFKSTIVASHLCNESRNPNCYESFTKIDLRNRPNIAPLYLSFSFFWKYCPLTVFVIDVSNNSLKGSFPSDVFQCSQIHALDLSHNELTGDVPLESFSSLSNLSLLNLSYNHFSECRVSELEFLRRFHLSSFIQSGLLPDHRRYRIKAMVFLICFPVFVILMVVYSGWICFCRPDLLPSVFQCEHKFTLPILKAATNGFSDDYLVGKFGELEIYRGTLRDGTETKIEIYRNKITSEKQRKFVEGCKILVQLDHQNLVRVLGWCNHRGLRAIVTEWIDGDSIETWLLLSPPWKQRLKILKGVVEGMCYLDEQWPEVEYDLRTNTVIVSEDQEPLISRFAVGVQGSSSRKLSGIFNFGVFLLEMVVHRQDDKDINQEVTEFIEWVKMQYPDNVQKLMDDRTKKIGITCEQAAQVIGLALMCTDLSRQPSLDQISNVVTRVYESQLVSETPRLKRSSRVRDEGQKRNHER